MNGSERDDLCFMPALELRALIEDRSLSATEILESVLDRIQEVNPEVNAYVSVRADAALAEAKYADGTVERGQLHGIPISVKDTIETCDLPTTFGCRALAGHQAGVDAVVIERLRNAGAIVVGKTNTSEFGLRPTTENSLFGPTSNPWSLEHNAGGSSGGAAAATASGISPLAIGSDGGGSCRIPSSCCSVVGLKPTRGRVPLAPTSYELWGGLIVIGVIARTVRDVALMLDVAAGPAVGEPYGLPSVETSFLAACDTCPKGLRIGYCSSIPEVEVDQEVLSAFGDGLRTLAALGHELIEVDPGLAGLRAPYMTIKQGNTAAMIKAGVPDASWGELESNTLAIAQRGFAQTAAEYCHAIDCARRSAAGIMQRLHEFDALATPTLTKPPVPHGLVPAMDDYDERWRFCLDWHAFTFPFNITGQPAISVPAGWSADGLPIGLQLVGRTGDEVGVLGLAAAYEAAVPWADLRPHPATRSICS